MESRERQCHEGKMSWSPWKNLPFYRFFFFVGFFYTLCPCIVILNNNTFSTSQSRWLLTVLHLSNTIVGNRRLQLCSFHVQIAWNGQYFSDSTKQKARISTNGVPALVLVLVSYSVITYVCLVFYWQAKSIFERLTFLVKRFLHMCGRFCCNSLFRNFPSSLGNFVDRWLWHIKLLRQISGVLTRTEFSKISFRRKRLVRYVRIFLLNHSWHVRAFTVSVYTAKMFLNAFITELLFRNSYWNNNEYVPLWSYNLVIVNAMNCKQHIIRSKMH